MRRSKSRVEVSFLKIDPECAKKVEKLYGMKKKGLVKLAEKTIVFGIPEDDPSATDNIEEYFKRLRAVFSNKYRYYLCAQYVFIFSENVLIDMVPVYGTTRDDTQKTYKQNKLSFENLDRIQQQEIRDLSVQSFKIEAGLEKSGHWRTEFDGEVIEDY